MKKAKIILTAMGIMAIVGGTLAFKAHKSYNGFLRCTFTTIPTNICPMTLYTTTIVGVPALCKPTWEPCTAPCTPATVVFHL